MNHKKYWESTRVKGAYRQGRADVIEELKKLLNVTHFIEGYGDMIYALDLEIELGLIPTVEQLKE